MKALDNYECEGQISIFEILNQDTWYGKTFQEHSVQTKETTLGAYLRKFAELKIKPPQFLCLKRENGAQADVLWGGSSGDLYSVAWRVHDAQFWGVPQRRKRIALVADFGGESAPEILFERKGLSGNTEPSRQERKNAPDNIERSIGETGSFQERAGKPGGGQRNSHTERENRSPVNNQQSVFVSGGVNQMTQQHPQSK